MRKKRLPENRTFGGCNVGAEFSAEEVEFAMAMDAYKRRNGRPFPTCSEVLEVVFALGYRKVAERLPLPNYHPRDDA